MGDEITPKMKEVLQLLAKGYNAKEIGKKLENSDATINTIRHQMIRRFRAKNVTHLVYIATKEGWIE